MAPPHRGALLLTSWMHLICRAASEPICNYVAGSDSTGISPFIFYQHLANGSKAEVQPQSDHTTGLCTYPEASCEDGSFRCCEVRHEYTRVPGISMDPQSFNALGNALVILLPISILRIVLRCRARFQRNQAQAADVVAEGETNTSSHKSRLLKILGGIGLMLVIGADVALMVIVAQMTQSKLTVPIRNAMLAAGVFLTPVREIFQFLEDIVIVKINTAVGAKDTHTARRVLRLGVLGGMFLGSLAAALVTVLCYITPVIELLLAPFTLHGGTQECSLVPTAAAVTAMARPYVLLSVWAWPFSFANMAMRGFLIGLKEWGLFGLLIVAEQGIGVVGMYVFFAPDPNIKILGWIPFVGSSFATVFIISWMYCRRRIREPYLPLPQSWQPKSCSEADAADAEAQTTSEDQRRHAEIMPADASWYPLLKEGFAAMVADLAVQIPLTVGTYMTAITMGIGAMYQIASLQAAFPQYGINWAYGLSFMFRIKGSTLLGQGDFEGFYTSFKVTVLYVALLAASSLATTAPFGKQIGIDLAQQACEYAAEATCLPVYESIFGGGRQPTQTLQGSSFQTFVPALCAVCFYRVFKAGLYACQDFQFMAKAGSYVFVLVFAPAIVVARLINSPAAALAAMYLPCLFLALSYAFRTRTNIRNMLEGRSGPWTVNASGHEAKAVSE